MIKKTERQISDEMLREAIGKCYNKDAFSNRNDVTGEQLLRFYEAVCRLLKKNICATPLKAELSLHIPAADEEVPDQISEDELFHGFKKLFGVFPNSKGRYSHKKIYTSSDFADTKPQYLGNVGGAAVYSQPEGGVFTEGNNMVPRPRSPPRWRENDMKDYSRQSDRDRKKYAEEALIRFAADQNLIENKKKQGQPPAQEGVSEQLGFDFDSSTLDMMGLDSGAIRSMMSMSEELGLLGLGGYGRRGFEGFSTSLLSDDGTVNKHGALGCLVQQQQGKKGFGMGHNHLKYPIIPNFYEVPKADIKVNPKTWGTHKQSGVWALGWRQPGIPDGVKSYMGPISSRPGAQE